MSQDATSFADYALDAAAKFQPSREGLLFDNRMKLLRRTYLPIRAEVARARRILDFGCGAGELLVFLRAWTTAELYGYDVSRSQLALARERCAGAPGIRIWEQLPPLERRFDLVFSSHVIEHVPDAELPGFVGRMLSRLAPGGRLVVATPNGLNPFAYAYFMSTDCTHVRMHSPFTLSELVRPHGFDVLSVHRETPQAYDLPSALKTAVWALASPLLRLALLATAGGVRGLRHPLPTAPTFYAVIGKRTP